VPTVALLECHGKLHALGTQLIVEGTQIAVIQKTEMICPPGVVAGKARKWLDRTCGHGGFALPVAANDQGLAAQLKENLRRAIGDRVGDDLGAKHLDVPVGRLMRGLADDVDVIKGECGIAHGDKASSQ
jgi:hypothetical protein